MKKRTLTSILIILFAVSLIPSVALSQTDEKITTSNLIAETKESAYVNKFQSEFNEITNEFYKEETINLLDVSTPEVYTSDNKLNNQITFLEKQSFVQDLSSRIKLTVNDTPDVTQIYYERLSDNTVTTYGLADESIRIHIFVKGLISNGETLQATMRRDIVGWFDEDHAIGVYTFSLDLLGSETFHLIWDVTLDENQGDFGLGFQDIRSYFLKIEIQSGTMLYDGNNLDTYKLWMCGYLKLYGIQYYNYTTEAGWVPVSYAVPGWEIKVTFYIAVVNAPIWGFDLQGVIKADVVWGIDETWYQDDEKTLSSVIEPGLYYYEWSDVSWNPYYFIVPADDYGNSPGDIRGLFGVMYMDGNEIDPLDPDYERDQLNIISTTIDQPPEVIIELPLDGYVTYNSTLSLDASVTDPNSNYDIVSVEILLEGSWTDITGLYNPTIGRLDIIGNNVFTTNGLKNITIKATDSNGNVGYDSTLIQYFSYGFFFPDTYIVDSSREILDIFSEEFKYDYEFNWGNENTNVTITPYFSVSVNATVEYEMLLAYPSVLHPGDDFTAYIKVANPEIHIDIEIDLGADYTFSAGENFYSGSSSLYNEVFSKGLPLSFGVFRIDLRDLSSLIESITHLEFETKDFLPAIIDWLASFKLEIDFIPILKIMNLLTFDITGVNCNPVFTSLSVSTDSMYAIPCTVSSSVTGNDDVTLTLDNYQIEVAAGFEAYCQMTFSGKILGIPIGPIDVNQWLYDYFGIQIPYLDFWLVSVSIPFAGSQSIIIGLSPLSFDYEIIEMFYALDNITYTLKVTDSKGQLVTGATVQVDDHSSTYYATDEGGGIYEVVMDYYDLPEVIDITISKSGYTTLVTNFNLYVDPPAVSKGVIWEYTALSVGTIALAGIITAFIVFRLKRRN
ncbi:MAG: hypothetical protein KAU62_16320 [Candidatus Heimdallarchaeota archaeon]|nr:hypothetical protein [Candidatus Heimdallarchaeota archaeon]MCK4612721.1 hypothetical protein [Candidatus Heimdallarchaeota archaeon]